MGLTMLYDPYRFHGRSNRRLVGVDSRYAIIYCAGKHAGIGVAVCAGTVAGHHANCIKKVAVVRAFNYKLSYA